MKLIHHNETIDSILLDNDGLVTSHSLKETENNFYKLFELNPCPIIISDLINHKIIDVNVSFLKVVGFKSKNEVIGKLFNESIDIKNLEYIKKEIEKRGEIKNYFCNFNTSIDKKINGVFSGSIIDLNSRKYLFLLCQVVNPNFIAKVATKLFKTSLIF